MVCAGSVQGLPSFQERDGGGPSLVHLTFCRTFLCCGMPACGTRESSHSQFAYPFYYLALRAHDTLISCIPSCAHAGRYSLCALGACLMGGRRGLRRVRLCSPGVLMPGEGGLGRTLGCGPACTIPHLIQNYLKNDEQRAIELSHN